MRNVLNFMFTIESFCADVFFLFKWVAVSVNGSAGHLAQSLHPFFREES